jgi:transposase
MEKGTILDTIWEVPDDLWEEIEPIILELDSPKPTGRKRTNPRQMLNGIIYRMRSSCQWNQLPKELGDDSPKMGSLRPFPQDLGHHPISL